MFGVAGSDIFNRMLRPTILALLAENRLAYSSLNGIGGVEKKRRKNLHALDTQGTHIIRIGNIPSLDRF